MRERLRAAAQLVCIVGMVLATGLIGVGLAAMHGRGTVGLLDAALLTCMVPAVLVFLATVLAMMRGRSFRRTTLHIRRPYLWAILAACAVALGSAVVSVSGEHTAGGKTTTCASGYCRYNRNDSRLVPISTTAYLEDQAGGAVFAGGWSIAAQTIALGVLRGAVTMRPRRGRFF